MPGQTHDIVMSNISYLTRYRMSEPGSLNEERAIHPSPCHASTSSLVVASSPRQSAGHAS